MPGAALPPPADRRNVVKETIKKIMGRLLRRQAGNTGWLKLGLVLLLGLMAGAARAQTNFASALLLTGDYGSVTVDNTGVVPDLGAPTIAGLPPQHTVWFQWSTTNSGEVELDTIGSVDDVLGVTNLDTVLGVYTGTSVANLNLVSANDNIYPNYQFNEFGQNIYTTGDTNYTGSSNAPPVLASGLLELYYQPFSGPPYTSSGGTSGLRFNAVAGTTYYFAVDTRSASVLSFSTGTIFTTPAVTGPGLISLNWSLHSSGVFRFATEYGDLTGLTYPDGVTPMLLYPCAATESTIPNTAPGDAGLYGSFNDAYGVLVTITRTAGSYGRVTVDYTTADLTNDASLMQTNGFLINGDLPAVGNLITYTYTTNIVPGISTNIFTNTFVSAGDYTPTSGTLTFDDFEMSKTILIPLVSQVTATGRPNRDFGVILSNPQLDPSESTVVSTPRVDPQFGEAVVRILDVDVDPNGLSQTQVTNQVLVYNTNVVPPQVTGTNNVISTVYSTTATNAVFNFQKANYRVYRAGTNQTFTIYVNRTGTNASAQTINFSVNSTYPFAKSNPNSDYYFPLQAGSDYATPDPMNSGNVAGRVPDFIFPGGYTGTLNWAAKDTKAKPITFNVYNNGLQQFNEDFQVDIYGTDANGNPIQVGMVNNCTVTILNASSLDGDNGVSNINPPAGAVDELYNADYGSDFFLNTVPPQMAHPGTDGEIYGLAQQPDGNTIVVGNFFSYDQTARNCIARATFSGYLDPTFDPGEGADDFIDCVVLTANNEVLIGGNFSSYNGILREGIALVNTNGALDLSFNPGEGFNGTVSCIALQPNGQVLVGGNFTMYNGLPCNYIARLNLDGSLDAAFNAGTTLNDSVDAIALQPNGQIVLGGDFTSVGGISGQDHIARLNTDGSLDTTFDPGSGVNGSVYAIGIQPDNNIVVGGNFTQANGQSLNNIARLTSTGALDANFFCGIGLDGPVYSLNVQTNAIFSTTNSSTVVQTNFTVYVGGQFTEYNSTHRLGLARINADGTIDTTFLDTAYNQFAGLTREYFSDAVGSVLTSVVQTNGDVLIGGSFEQVGGGEFDSQVRPTAYVGAFTSTITRDAVRNHSNIARLHGGATAGPGNVALDFNSYSVNESASSLFVALVRTNGFLGPAAANFSVTSGLAKNGVDFLYDGDFNGTSPLYWILWEYAGPTRMHSDGFFGENLILNDGVIGDIWEGVPYAYINLTITGNENSLNDLTAQFQLSNPAADQFFLGGEDIPLGVGLGLSSAPLTLIEDRHQSGTFGFASPSYTGTGLNAAIAITRTNGTYGSVSVTYTTTTNGSTAVAGSDYTPTPGGKGTLTFLATDTSKSFNVQILSSNYISSVEKTVNLLLTGINPPVNGIANLGLTNAVLRIINPNFQGYLNLSTNAYNANVSAGSVIITVTRTVGSKGTLNVLCATTNGTAINGTDYIGFTNLLTWNSGDVTPRNITVPLINSGTVGGSKFFGVKLYNPTNNAVSTPSLFAASGTTNAVVTINNNNSYGTFQFSSPNYVVNENGGYSTITVTRTGSSNGTASVQFATTNNTAFAGTNYMATNGTLTFVPGQLAASFNVPILDDGVMDPPPSAFFFNIVLSNPSSGALLGTPTVASNEIVDAESYNRPPGNPDTTFNPGTGMNGDVLALALQSSGQIIAGGNFTTVNGVPENYTARLDVNGTLDNAGFLSGMSAANGSVYALADQSDDQILVGGAFTSFDGYVRNRITRLNTDGSIDTSFNPGAGADNTVYGIAETFTNGVRQIYLAGAFSTVNGISHPNLARLNNNGTVDGAFAPGTGPDAPVYAVAAYPTNSIFAGKLVVGGAFSNINSFAVGHVARLNADGSTDTNFDLNLNASATVRAIAIQSDGRILIGGDFTSVNGMALNHIARLNTDGSLDNSFTGSIATTTNGTVNAIAVQLDGRIVVVGQFSQASGVTRNGITRLLSNGAVDPTIDFGDGANGAVDALVIQPADQMLVIGGGFTQYNDQTAEHVVRVYGGSETGSGSFEFTSGNYQVDENGGQELIGIRRTGGTSGPNADGSGNISVNFATSDGTATAGINYSSVSLNVSFPPGEVLQYVPVPVIDDSNITPDLTVNLTLSNPTAPSILGDQPTAVLTIINVDSAVNFSSSEFSVAKTILTGLGTLDVQRIGATNGTSFVDYLTTTNGTAVIGTDYYPTNGTLTFNPGDTDKIIYVPIINNGISEGNRTVDVALTNNVGTLLYAPSNSVLTIVDTVQAPGQLFFAATNYVAGSGDGNATLTVLRTNGTSGTVSVTYSTQPGTALPGVNYNSVSNTVTFNDGDTVKTFAVPLINYPNPQGPVSFSVLLSNPTGGAGLIAPTNATVTINNTNVGVAFVLATNTVSEKAGTVSLFVSRLGSTSGAASVNYASSNGTAVAGINFIAVSGVLTFNSGENLKVISVPLIYDPQVTGSLLFTVGLTSTNPGVVVVSPQTTTVVEQDADAGLSFTNANFSVLKNAGYAVITVVCSNPGVEPVVLNSNTVPLSVHYATADGTATAGIDYITTSGTLDFTNGIGTNTFLVPIINNNSSITGNRTFTVSLSNPTPPGQVTPIGTQTVTIIDNNSGLQFSSPNYTVLKTNVSATINVIRTGYTNDVVSVNFIATNGTATAGLNFIATNGTLVFTNGVTNQTFSVNVIDTTAVQPNLTVLLQLLNPTNDILVTPSAATLTILDNTGSYVVPAGAALTYESGPVNGIIDPNETVTLLFGFRDAGFLNVTNLVATLLPVTGVTSPSGSQNYGPLIAGGHSVSEPFTFTANGTNGQAIVSTFSLADSGKPIGTNTFTFTLGSWTTKFTNAASIVINDYSAASPYPSPISVSGVGGTLIKATVTVTNMNHTRASDIAMLVVSPAVKDTLLEANAGGSHAISDVTITFDDAATNSPLPQTGQIVSGTNAPTAYLPVLQFP
jgi:uncharacterized delta-60 repeat protein